MKQKRHKSEEIIRFLRCNMFSAIPNYSDTSLELSRAIISILAACCLNSLVDRRLFIAESTVLENPASIFLRTDHEGLPSCFPQNKRSSRPS